MAFLKNVSLPAFFEGSETTCSYADSVNDNGNKAVSNSRNLFSFFSGRPLMAPASTESVPRREFPFLNRTGSVGAVQNTHLCKTGP